MKNCQNAVSIGKLQEKLNAVKVCWSKNFDCIKSEFFVVQTFKNVICVIFREQNGTHDVTDMLSN